MDTCRNWAWLRRMFTAMRILAVEILPGNLPRVGIENILVVAYDEDGEASYPGPRFAHGRAVGRHQRTTSSRRENFPAPRFIQQTNRVHLTTYPAAGCEQRQYRAFREAFSAPNWNYANYHNPVPLAPKRVNFIMRLLTGVGWQRK